MTYSASDLLNAGWDGKLPIKPGVIANSVGVRVIADPRLAATGVSGQIELEDGVPVIRYNPSEPHVRQRFTIAHELGHWGLGHLEGGERMFRDTTKQFMTRQWNPLESDANRFAAELLMPAHIVRFLISEKGVTHPANLAELFDVSTAAMGYRMSNLQVR